MVETSSLALEIKFHRFSTKHVLHYHLTVMIMMTKTYSYVTTVQDLSTSQVQTSYAKTVEQRFTRIAQLSQMTVTSQNVKMTSFLQKTRRLVSIHHHSVLTQMMMTHFSVMSATSHSTSLAQMSFVMIVEQSSMKIVRMSQMVVTSSHVLEIKYLRFSTKLVSHCHHFVMTMTMKTYSCVMIVQDLSISLAQMRSVKIAEQHFTKTVQLSPMRVTSLSVETTSFLLKTRRLAWIHHHFVSTQMMRIHFSVTSVTSHSTSLALMSCAKIVEQLYMKIAQT